MPIIPTIRSSNMRRSVEFYTGVLDFERSADAEQLDDPCFVALTRAGEYLFLSSHSGDGAFGQAVVVTTPDVDALFARLRERGLVVPDRPESPVHRRPLDQTWGTREFYVDDPDGNTIRFTQYHRS